MYDKQGTSILSTILVAIILLIVATFLLSSCSSSEPSAAAEPMPTPTEVVLTEEDPYLATVYAVLNQWTVTSQEFARLNLELQENPEVRHSETWKHRLSTQLATTNVGLDILSELEPPIDYIEYHANVLFQYGALWASLVMYATTVELEATGAFSEDVVLSQLETVWNANLEIESLMGDIELLTQ